MKSDSWVVSQIKKNFLAGSFGRAIAMAEPILLVPFMIDAWGLSIYGEWLIITAIPAYVMLSPDFGLTNAAVNRMAFLTAENKSLEAVWLYRTVFIFMTIFASFFVLIGWIIAKYMAWNALGVELISTTNAITIVVWFCVRLYFAQQTRLLSGIYKSARKNPRYAAIGGIGQLVYLIVSIVALLQGAEPEHFAFIVTLAYAIYFLVPYFDSRKIMPIFTLSVSGVSVRILRPQIVPGLGFVGNPLVRALQNQGVLIVISATLGAASAAIFQTTRVLSNAGKGFIDMFANAVTAELSFLVGQRKFDTILRLLKHNSRLALLIVFLGFLGITLFGSFFYKLWLGDSVSYHSEMVTIMFFGLIPFAAGKSFSVFLIASNKIHLAIIPLLLVAVSSIVFVYIGATELELAGAALGILYWEFGLFFVLAAIVSSQGINVIEFMGSWIRFGKNAESSKD